MGSCWNAALASGYCLKLIHLWPEVTTGTTVCCIPLVAFELHVELSCEQEADV